MKRIDVNVNDIYLASLGGRPGTLNGREATVFGRAPEFEKMGTGI